MPHTMKPLACNPGGLIGATAAAYVDAFMRNISWTAAETAFTRTTGA